MKVGTCKSKEGRESLLRETQDAKSPGLCQRPGSPWSRPSSLCLLGDSALSLAISCVAWAKAATPLRIGFEFQGFVYLALAMFDEAFG